MNGGAVMPAWFDIQLSKLDRVDEEGIMASVAYLGIWQSPETLCTVQVLITGSDSCKTA
jgi:hypothetical protein